MKLKQVIEKAEKYKYEGCRNKFIRKHFGFGNHDLLTPLVFVKIVKKIMDFEK